MSFDNDSMVSLLYLRVLSVATIFVLFSVIRPVELIAFGYELIGIPDHSLQIEIFIPFRFVKHFLAESEQDLFREYAESFVL